jgi:signal transduction histidine kinase/ActR/RegA family two-component response regulator
MVSDKKISLRLFISREFYKAAVIPLVIIEITLLGLYFLMNSYLLDRSINTLTSDRLTHLQEIVGSQRRIISEQLHAVADLTTVLQSEAVRFFRIPAGGALPEPSPEFGYAENGVYYKILDNGGGGVFYSSRTAIGPAEKEKALRSEVLDPVFMQIYNANRNIVSVYLNTYDSMSRHYPYYDNVFELLPGDMDFTAYDLYYLADAEHDSGRHPIWTDARRDQLSKKWILSCVAPVYQDYFLEGVIGVDISIKKFIDNLMALELPWGAHAFMMNPNGGILAMPPDVETLLELGDIPDVDSQSQEAESSTTSNLLDMVMPCLKESLSTLMEKESGVIEFPLNNHTYLLCQATVVETGWKLMVIADKETILAPVEQLERLADRVGFGAVGFMALLGFLMLFNLAANTRRMSRRLARTLGGLSDALKRLGTGVYETPVASSPVRELAVLSDSFEAMALDLKAMHGNLEQEVRHATEAKNTATQAQAALKEHQAHLEKTVEKRTLELQEANRNLQQDIAKRQQMEQERRQLMVRLQRAEKMEALGTLAGGVAHDLNNILSGIVGYPDLLLLEMGPDDPFRKPVETMQKSGQKAAAIVQDLLTLARRGVSVMEVTNLNHIISGYLASPEHFRLLQDHPGVRVEKELSGELYNCMGAAVHLSKMIMNLVSNAAEAMAEGGAIRITTRNVTVDSPRKEYQEITPGQYVAMRVVDSGHGISEEDLGHIFEPFYTKKKMGRSGTGLGMAVVWGTVQDHEGYIDVKSAIGRGTDVEILLPVTLEKAAPRQEKGAFERLRGNGETILVVDDVPLQGEIAVSMLTKLEYSAFFVDNGEAAVAWLKEKSADLVILDMIMAPHIDGLETYKRILEVNPEQRAIIVSGFSETDAVREVLALGAGQYVKKPYTVETIGRAVQKELRREKP